MKGLPHFPAFLPATLGCFLSVLSLGAQLPYTVPLFEVRTEADIFWGTATGYTGRPDSLFLDLYKPVNDDNCLRPVLLMIHGGAWIAGTRKDPEVRSIGEQMAQRGYLVASLEYRLGYHKRASYTPYAACPLEPCLYAADSSEIRRAVFRGMQDAKGALRYLASRQEADSIDLENVFVGGVSAGAFIALQTALMDLPEEKPPAAFTLEPAPAADPDLASCNGPDPDYSRPDLGPIQGTLYPGIPSPSIRGAAAFMGGLFNDLLTGPDTPAVYLYHQSNDLIVGCGQTRPLGPLFQHCLTPLNLCQTMTPFPTAAGSCALNNQWSALGQQAPPYFADILNNGGPNGFTCLADPPTHSILNIPLRCQNLAGFFAPLIAATGNDPAVNCPTSVYGKENTSSWQVFPNPCGDAFSLLPPPNHPGSFTLEIFSLNGRLLRTASTDNSRERTFHFPPGTPSGLYWLKITSKEGASVVPIIKH